MSCNISFSRYISCYITEFWIAFGKVCTRTRGSVHRRALSPTNDSGQRFRDFRGRGPQFTTRGGGSNILRGRGYVQEGEGLQFRGGGERERGVERGKEVDLGEAWCGRGMVLCYVGGGAGEEQCPGAQLATLGGGGKVITPGAPI